MSGQPALYFSARLAYPAAEEVEVMNNSQERAKQVLQEEIKKRRGLTIQLPDRGESEEGYFFTEVERVTVIIGVRGRYALPAVRTYPKPLYAAVYAGKVWKAQIPDSNCVTGHFDPLVTTDWYCGSPDCPCKREPYEQRFKRGAQG
jgi:hypothetical protein